VSAKRALIAAAAIAATILTAAATPAAATQTPGEQIAAALAESPLYVDPSLSYMFPAA
jgi:ABC-type oligopeptide transport system substrate-binding subunit